MEMILVNNNAMVSLTGMSMVRANIIAQRTHSDVFGLLKSQMIETLKAKMANGIAHFCFLKKDGTIREAWGTIQSNIANAKINGRGISRENYATCAFFDVEKGDWRSFRWETLVKVF